MRADGAVLSFLLEELMSSPRPKTYRSAMAASAAAGQASLLTANAEHPSVDGAVPAEREERSGAPWKSYGWRPQFIGIVFLFFYGRHQDNRLLFFLFSASGSGGCL